MIVSEKNISDALAYLAIDPHPLALARKHVVDSENLKKQVFAECFLEAEGSIEVRKAHAETNERYIDARNNEADDIMELERHKARSAAANMLIEVWRSENANVRAAERVR